MSKKNKNGAGRVLDVVLSLALIAGIGYGGYYVAANGKSIDQKSTFDFPEPTEEVTEAPENAIIYQEEKIPNTELHNGVLVLVNESAPFEGSESDLVSLYEKRLDAETDSFATKDAEVQVKEITAEHLIAMFDAFFEETYDNGIIVESGFRSREKQQEVYEYYTGIGEEDRAAKPGCSEHQTGLCVDLGLPDGEDYDGTGIYSWIDEHCAEYGFVLRYPEDKVDITGIRYEPWHYRYIGTPHANYLMENKLCLEEYVELIKQYPYDPNGGEHLRVTDTDGKIYEVYYYPMTADSDFTEVPVPSTLPYTVLGNNCDGFIVTVDTGETAGEQTADPTENETVEETEEETAEANDEEA